MEHAPRHESSGRQKESPLSKQGLSEAAKLAARVQQEGIQFDAVYCSSAVRCQQTAKACGVSDEAIAAGLSDVLLEQSQGSWEGEMRDACYTPEVLAARNDLARRWAFAAPGVSSLDGGRGESEKDVEERVVQFIEGTVLPAAAPVAPVEMRAILSGKWQKALAGIPTVGVFTHGTAVKCFLRHITGSAPLRTQKITMENCCITEVVYIANPGNIMRGGWYTRRINDASHEYETAARKPEDY